MADKGKGPAVPMSIDARNAQKSFLAENSVETLSGDALFYYDSELHRKICDEQPWRRDPHYFKKVRISATALIKMVMHARSGGTIEVMGMMVGKILGDTMVVMDAFALPVEGTETRVNAGVEAFEYMVQFVEDLKRVGRKENAIGWYHSHPGYGCWLSGIDVNTQMTNQQYQEPWLAIVIDPVRTISAGKVQLAAFRTYPKDYKPPDEKPSEYQSIPLNKIEDFGVHAKHYYPLEVSYFKSSLDQQVLDLLWNKYWVNTLSSSPFLANREYAAAQITDLAGKLEQAEAAIQQSGRLAPYLSDKKRDESPLTKLTKDSARIAHESAHAQLSQVMKDMLFNQTA